MIAPGATVSEGQAVMELETDKAVVEVPSSVTGTVKDIRVKEGEKIKVGQVIFTVENGSGSAQPSAPAKEPASPAKPAPARPATTESAQAPATAPAGRRSSDPAAPTEFRLPELGENLSQRD